MPMLIASFVAGCSERAVPGCQVDHMVSNTWGRHGTYRDGRGWSDRT